MLSRGLSKRFAVLASTLVVRLVTSEDAMVQCEWCGGEMLPEHAHYKCTECGQRDSCCDGGECSS